jgi:putative spermidine/putrescine transport system substrate-binding protein
MKKIILILSVIFVFVNAESLTVISWGGAYGDAQKKHMIDPFSKLTGTKVYFNDYKGGVAEIKAQVDSKAVKWDVVDLEYIDVDKACSENMLLRLDTSFLKKGDDDSDAADDFYKGATHECAIGNIYWSVVYAYKDSINGKKPTTIKDFFDLKKFPGKRGMRKRAQVNFEWALIADGVNKNKVYDMLETKAGQERALRKLDTIKDHIVWYDSWSQAPQGLNDGTFVMAQSGNGRLIDFTIVWDSHAYDLDGWGILRGSKKVELAKRFINFATSTIPLSGMKDVNYGPTRKSSGKLLSEKEKSKLPSAHLKEGFKVNGGFWSDYATELNEKFNAWLLKK